MADPPLAEGASALVYSSPMSTAPALRLTRAQAPQTRQVQVLDEFGVRREVSIPAERPLTVFVDRRELVTLMTLGASPELLVLGLRNQRLVDSVDDIDSITVDWEVGAAAVKTRAGIERFDEDGAPRRHDRLRPGTVFGGLMDELHLLRLPPAGDAAARLAQPVLYRLLDAVRRQESTYKSAGSVHGCALFRQDEMLSFVEGRRPPQRDRHAGRLDVAARHRRRRQDLLHHRSADERDGHQVGAARRADHRLAQRHHRDGPRTRDAPGHGLFGRAANRHFVCYSGFGAVRRPPSRRAP